MAIVSIDGVVEGLNIPQNIHKVTGTMEAAGVLHSLFYVAGVPGAAAAPAPGINGAALTTYGGQIPFTNPVSGNKYLAKVVCAPSVAGSLHLIDRLWHNSGLVVTTTTAQAITAAALPARDNNGTTDGEGVFAAIEVRTATTNASAITNCTCTYTNSAGVTGRVGTIASFPATAAAGTFVPFLLAEGDTGVRAIESVTLGTSMVAGAIHIVLYRQLAIVPCPVLGAGSREDAVSLGMPRLYNNTVPQMLWLPSATTTTSIFGQVVYTEG